MNTAADFLSRLEIDPNEKISLKIREDIPTKPIEVNIESLQALHKTVRSFLILQTNKRPQKKNFGNVKKKYEMPYLPTHQSSQCRVITQMTYTETQQF